MHWFNNRYTNNNWLKFVHFRLQALSWILSTVRHSGLEGPTEDMGVLQEARGNRGNTVSKGGREKQKLESLPSKKFYPILINAKSLLKHVFSFSV